MSKGKDLPAPRLCEVGPSLLGGLRCEMKAELVTAFNAARLQLARWETVVKGVKYKTDCQTSITLSRVMDDFAIKLQP